MFLNLFLVLILLCSIQPIASSYPSASTNNITINPVADSYVDSKDVIGDSRVNLNFGGQGRLDVYYWHTYVVITEKRFTYLLFNLSDFPPQLQIASASLKLFAREVSATLDIAVHYCSDNSWTETGITWNNRPMWTEQSTASVVVSTPNLWISWDITKDVKAILQASGKFLTEVLIPDETGDLDATVRFDSKEAGAFQPRLEITYEKLQLSLDLDPPGSREINETIRFSGSISPAWQGVEIIIRLTDPDGKMVELPPTKTDSQGKYHADYFLNKKGYWKVMATSEGNQFFEAGTSSEKSFPASVPPLEQSLHWIWETLLVIWPWVLLLLIAAILIWYFFIRQ